MYILVAHTCTDMIFAALVRADIFTTRVMSQHECVLIWSFTARVCVDMVCVQHKYNMIIIVKNMLYPCGWLPHHCLYMLMLMTCAIVLRY